MTEMLRQTSCTAVPTTDSKKHVKGGLEPGVRNRNAAMKIDGPSEVIFSLDSTEKCAYTAPETSIRTSVFQRFVSLTISMPITMWIKVELEWITLLIVIMNFIV